MVLGASGERLIRNSLYADAIKALSTSARTVATVCCRQPLLRMGVATGNASLLSAGAVKCMRSTVDHVCTACGSVCWVHVHEYIEERDFSGWMV